VELVKQKELILDVAIYERHQKALLLIGATPLLLTWCLIVTKENTSRSEVRLETAFKGGMRNFL